MSGPCLEHSVEISDAQNDKKDEDKGFDQEAEAFIVILVSDLPEESE